jgi:hypothetical protein
MLVHRLTLSSAAAWVAGLWFLATMARFFTSYVGVNDPTLLGLAIMAWALVWLMKRAGDDRPVEPAIAMMVVAGFFKHSLVAIPLTSLIWVGSVNRWLGVRAAVFGAGLAALGLAACGLAWGDAFFANLMSPRVYDFRHVWGGLGRLQWIAPALIIFAIWAPQDWRDGSTRFAALFIVIAIAVQCIEKSGDGVADNAQFELAVAAAVGLGIAFARIESAPWVRGFGADHVRVAIIGVLIIRLLASTNTLPYRVLASPAFRLLMYEHALVAQAEAMRIRAIPEPVVCSIATVCRMAGKAYLFDHFNVMQRIRTGRLSGDELSKATAALHARFEMIDRRASARFD